MNCRRFQNQLHEYVEGSLSAGARAAAGRHLASCDVCRQAVRAEQKFAQTLSHYLRLDTETLALRVEIQRNILAASRCQPVPPPFAESIAALWRRYVRLAAIPASLLLIALLTLHYSGPRAPKTVPQLAAAWSGQVQSSAQPVVSIQISLPTCKFRREGNLVVDTLSYETVSASETLPPGGQEPVASKPEIKNSL